jgi:chromosome segregation protein
MAQLPYTKILAVLAAPPEEREELAAAAEDISAAEIRRLTEERNKAAEAANVETNRAEQAEKTIEDLRAKLQESERLADQRLEDLKQAREETGEMIKSHNDEIGDLKARLLTAENNRVEVEKIPADYQNIKDELAEARRNARELMDAAAEAEERASAAEAELEEVRAENAQNGTSEFEKMHYAMKTFLMQCEMMAVRPERLLRDAERVLRDVKRLRDWCDAMSAAMSAVHTAEGAVV